MRSAALRVGLVLVGLSGMVGVAHANERPSDPNGSPCPDWCGYPQAWETAESGTGPETSMSTILGLGIASESLAFDGGGHLAETAAVFGFEFRFPMVLKDSSRGADSRVMRLRVMGQQLGWRVGDALMPSGQVERGASVALGFTGTLRWFSRHSKLAATLDAEGATGLGVRAGLGLRTLDTSSRAVGAAGLALGLHSRVGGLRAHARVLRALTADPGWSNGVEVGVGVATRFDWPRLHGPWPVELWADLRERRALGGGGAYDRELTTGLSYVPREGFSRIGLVGSSTHERLADGTIGSGRALMIQFDRPFGSL